MRDTVLMSKVWFYGGEGAKPEPAKPKPTSAPDEKPAEPAKPAGSDKH